MKLKEVLWCGEGDLNPHMLRGVCKLLTLHSARRAETGKKAGSGHNLGTRTPKDLRVCRRSSDSLAGISSSSSDTPATVRYVPPL
jgi:hypothetical protein